MRCTLERFSETSVIFIQIKTKQAWSIKGQTVSVPLRVKVSTGLLQRACMFQATVHDDVNAAVLKTSSQTQWWKYSTVRPFQVTCTGYSCQREIPLYFGEACYPFWLSNMCGRGFILQQDIDPEHAWTLLYARSVWCPRKSKYYWLMWFSLRSR